MVKKIAYCANILLLLVFGATLAGAAQTLAVTSGQSHLLSAVTLPESVALVALGSLLIAGAMVLRRRWPSHREESKQSKAASSAE